MRRVAELHGRSLSDFVTTPLQSAVQRDIVEIGAVRLSREGSERFAAALGRLAVGAPFQGRKLGSSLLANAFLRSALADVAAFAMLVDPKDENARAFYARHGLKSLPDPERRMVLPIESALRYFREQTRD